MSFFRGARKLWWLKSQCIWMAGEGWGHLQGEHDRNLGGWGKGEECTIQTLLSLPFITEEYDRNYIHDKTSWEQYYTAMLIQGKGGTMFEKTNVRNKWTGDNKFPSGLSLFQARAFYLKSEECLGKAGLCSVQRAYSHQKPQDQVFVLWLTDLTSQQML